uniref:transcription initiation factor TFIID subunit 3-like n=1 Tax=Myxine glutinosa TaxID=7769 RepID=UPI00358E6EB4
MNRDLSVPGDSPSDRGSRVGLPEDEDPGPGVIVKVKVKSEFVDDSFPQHEDLVHPVKMEDFQSDFSQSSQDALSNECVKQEPCAFSLWELKNAPKMHEVEKIKRRFKNLRSAYGKLKNRAGSSGKSAQASSKLTSLQQWKLRNLAFLDEVIQPRTQGQELGRVAVEDEDEEDEDVGDDSAAPDSEAHDSAAHDTDDHDRGSESRTRGSSADSHHSSRNRAGTSTSTSSSTRMSRKKAAKTTPDVGELLHEMLMENRRRDRETEKKLEESASREPDEREAWGSWLQTVVRNCPKERFRQFQTETLALSQRYQPTDEGQSMSQQCPAPTPAPPAMSPFVPAPARGLPVLIPGPVPAPFPAVPAPAAVPIPTTAAATARVFAAADLHPNTQSPQQQQPHQHQQPARPTSAPTIPSTSNIFGDQDLLPALRTPALGDRLSLSGFSGGSSFGLHGTSADQSLLSGLMRPQTSSLADKADKACAESESDGD